MLVGAEKRVSHGGPGYGVPADMTRNDGRNQPINVPSKFSPRVNAAKNTMIANEPAHIPYFRFTPRYARRWTTRLVSTDPAILEDT